MGILVYFVLKLIQILEKSKQEDELVSDRASEVLQFYSDFINTCTGECYKQLIPSASFQRQVCQTSVFKGIP